MSSISKSIRMPVDVVNLIDSLPGSNFSDKLVSFIQDTIIQRDALLREVAALESKKLRLLNDCADLSTLEEKRRRISSSLSDIASYLKRTEKDVETYSLVVHDKIG